MPLNERVKIVEFQCMVCFLLKHSRETEMSSNVGLHQNVNILTNILELISLPEFRAIYHRKVIPFIKH